MQPVSQNKMAIKPIGPLVVSMAFPIMLSMMVQALYNIVDSIFIARVSEDALTAVSLAFPVQILIISLGVGTSIGMNSLLSRRLGAKKVEEASKVALHGLFLALASSILFVIIGFSISRVFFTWFTDSKDIIEMGYSYLVIVSTLSLGVFAQINAERIMQGTGNTITPMITQVTGAVINIILDPILIFGWFGLPAMGVTGAAIATVIGQWSAMTLALIFMVRKTKELNFSLKGFKVEKRIIVDIYRVGLPSTVMQSIGSVMTVGMNTILISFSATAVAVFGIYFKLQSFVFMPVFGLVNALISIVAFNYGARDKQRIVASIRFGATIAFIVMLVGTLVFQFGTKMLLGMFNASDHMIDIGTIALRIISFHFPLAAIGITLSAAFQAIGKGVYSLYMSLVRQLVVLLPSAYLLSHLWGLNATWYSFLISELVSITMSIYLFAHLYRTKIKVLTPLTASLES
ncbi:MAG: MATE family efflux transporter [Sphaerochaetaceae bacterium]|jgi:putative MATE family efflux protein